MEQTSRLIALLALGGISLLPVDASSLQQKGKESFALFDSFTYKGEDTYYQEYPLSAADDYYNPILPGWYSDPSICRVGNDYFMVTSTFSYYPGVPLFHSTDLMNWKQIGHVLNRPSQLKLEGQHVSGGIFAPAISYNPKNQTYYMITTNVGQGNFFVKTKDPYGEWSDPIMLPSIQGIDPSFFFDKDGRAYIVNNDAPEGTPDYDGHRTIRIQEFDVKTDKTIGERRVIIDKGVHPEEKPIWIEGPHLYKVNNRYYLMAAEGGTGDRHSEVVFCSERPFGPYTPAKRNPILTQRHLASGRVNPVTCAGHADLVQTPSGKWFAVFLACRPYEGQFENLGRETFLMPVRWTSDGSPYITENDETIPLIGHIPGAVRDKDVTFGNFVRTDDFSGKILGLEWMTLRGPADKLYSLQSFPGYLMLKCSPVSASEKSVPAYIGRRIQHHKFECVTRMDCSSLENRSAAGILLFKDEIHQYFFCIEKEPSGNYIKIKKIGANGSEVILAKSVLPSDHKELSLKVISRGLTFDFFYTDVKGEWVSLCKEVDAGYLSTKVAGGFTGTTVGMYAVKYKN